MMIMRFTDKGIGEFTRFIDALRLNASLEFPYKILEEGIFSEPVGGDRSWLDEVDLTERLPAAKKLNDIIERLELASAERDVGFWAWCSAYLFDALCKRGKGGILKPGELAIWIPQPDKSHRYYRHYLASIWRVYLAHRNNEEKLIALLNGPVNTPGELWAQFAAYQLFITNSSMIDAIYHLYWDKEKNCRKRGAGGNSPRRLVQVLRQLERTWDFVAMTGDQIVALLPHEFDRFKESLHRPA